MPHKISCAINSTPDTSSNSSTELGEKESWKLGFSLIQPNLATCSIGGTHNICRHSSEDSAPNPWRRFGPSQPGRVSSPPTTILQPPCNLSNAKRTHGEPRDGNRLDWKRPIRRQNYRAAHPGSMGRWRLSYTRRITPLQCSKWTKSHTRLSYTRNGAGGVLLPLAGPANQCTGEKLTKSWLDLHLKWNR